MPDLLPLADGIRQLETVLGDARVDYSEVLDGTPADLAALLEERIDAGDASKDPGVDLYALAMNLRGNADGSAEGTDSTERLRVQWRYLELRVGKWTPGHTASDAALLTFFTAVLDETRAQFGGPEGEQVEVVP